MADGERLGRRGAATDGLTSRCRDPWSGHVSSAAGTRRWNTLPGKSSQESGTLDMQLESASGACSWTYKLDMQLKVEHDEKEGNTGRRVCPPGDAFRSAPLTHYLHHPPLFFFLRVFTALGN